MRTSGSSSRPSEGSPGPDGIAVAGNDIWVSNNGGQGGASVIELNAVTGARLRITAGAAYHFDQPSAIAASGPAIWVTNFAGNSVTELNAGNGGLIRVLKGPAYKFDHPRAIAVAGSHVFVANAYSSTLTELDARTGQFIRTIRGFAGPDGIAVAGNDIWVSNNGGQGGASVIELNAVTGARLRITAGAAYHFDQPSAIAASGAAIWVTNLAGNSVTELNGQQPPPSGSFTFPRFDAADIHSGQLYTFGTAQNIEKNNHLDVFLQFAGSNKYFAAGNPDTSAPLIGGNWTCEIDVGAPGNIILYLVDLSPASVRLVNSKADVPYQSNGYPSIVKLGTILASVQFTAK